MKRTILNSTIKISPRSSASLDNPYVNTVNFILTDDKPNANGVGVRREDFFSFAQSAIFMPIKMSEGEIGDHYKAKPIGAITQAEIDEDRVFGSGVLWPEERPADVALVKDKTSKGEAQISWEVSYDEDIIDDAGIIWLGNPKLLAATLVKYPAYDGRTPITSFASTSEEIMIEDVEVTEPIEEVIEEVTEPVEEESISEEEVIEETSTEEEDESLLKLQQELDELRKFKTFTERSKVVIELLGELPKKDLEELVELTDSQLKVVKRLVSSRKQEASVIPHIPNIAEDRSPLSIFKLALEKHIGG